MTGRDRGPIKRTARNIQRGQRVLSAYAELVTGQPFTLELDDQTALAGLLRDLRLMCDDDQDLDFGKALHDSMAPT